MTTTLQRGAPEMLARPLAKIAGITILSRDAWVPDGIAAGLKAWAPASLLGQTALRILLGGYLPSELALELFERIRAAVVVESSLALVHLHGPLSGTPGRRDDYGVVSRKVVTSAGVNYLAADFAGGANDSNLFKYHGLGTGTNAEATGDTALQTELTTQYNPDNTRATGSQSSSTNTYTTVGTNTVDASAAVTEHGLFTQAATGGGTLWDRSVFSVVNLASGDSLQSTYTLTISAGG
jgi:hypothetical protein